VFSFLEISGKLEVSHDLKGMLGNIVAVIFQSVFHSEMHQNNIFFLFFKINTSKQFKT
jgi:hypothetical protein